VRTNGEQLYSLTGFEERITFVDTEHHFAAFGQLTRTFGPLEAFGGMRGEFTTNDIERSRVETFAPRTNFSADRTEWNAQPRLGLRYRWSDAGSVYAQSSYGYKSGGFSYLETDPQLAEYATERVWANEVGVEAASGDRRFTGRGAIFYNAVSDYQVERLSNPPNITVVNAPRVASWGGEVELEAKPLDGLELRASVGYTRAEFTNFPDPLAATDYDGNRVPFVPELTAALDARYRHRSGVFAELGLVASGETFYDEANTAFLRQAPHAELNAKLGYERNAFRAYVFCDNATDARYFSQKIGYAGIGTPGAPRTVGAVLALEL
jgi:iron complex outermembrane receptor protein